MIGMQHSIPWADYYIKGACLHIYKGKIDLGSKIMLLVDSVILTNTI